MGEKKEKRNGCTQPRKIPKRFLLINSTTTQKKKKSLWLRVHLWSVVNNAEQGRSNLFDCPLTCLLYSFLLFYSFYFIFSLPVYIYIYNQPPFHFSPLEILFKFFFWGGDFEILTTISQVKIWIGYYIFSHFFSVSGFVVLFCFAASVSKKK